MTSGSNLVAAVWDGATGLGLYRSPRSTAWTAVNAGLGNLNVNALATATNLYAATDNGIYESTNGATSWTDYSAGLPSRMVRWVGPKVSGAFCCPQGGGVYIKGAAILPPQLVSPANNATGITRPTTLTWNYPVGTPGYYEAQYSTTATFTAPTTTTVSNIVATNIVIPELAPATSYYWRVRAYVDGAWTGYSAVWMFTMADFPAPPTTPTGITFAPATVYTTDTLTATASGSIDYNPGDTVSYE